MRLQPEINMFIYSATLHDVAGSVENHNARIFVGVVVVNRLFLGVSLNGSNFLFAICYHLKNVSSSNMEVLPHFALSDPSGSPRTHL